MGPNFRIRSRTLLLYICKMLLLNSPLKMSNLRRLCNCPVISLWRAGTRSWAVMGGHSRIESYCAGNKLPDKSNSVSSPRSRQTLTTQHSVREGDASWRPAEAGTSD